MKELVHLALPLTVPPAPELFISTCDAVHYMYATLLDVQLKSAHATHTTVTLEDVAAAVAGIDPTAIQAAQQWRAAFLQVRR